jgi:Flp pilus assembly pilin Flp
MGSFAEGITMVWIVANKEGQSLVEYALILFLVAISVVVGLSFLGVGLNDLYTRIMSTFPWA